MILIAILLALLPVVGNLYNNYKQKQLHVILKRETFSRAFTIRHAGYIHYEKYNLCRFTSELQLR